MGVMVGQNGVQKGLGGGAIEALDVDLLCGAAASAPAARGSVAVRRLANFFGGG